MESMETSLKTQLSTEAIHDLVCDIAQRFVDLYYKADISKMYCDNARMIFQGMCIEGKDEIAKLLSNLPECDYSVLDIDAQNLAADENLSRILIAVTGICEGQAELRRFSHTFNIIKQGTIWAIESDRLRVMEHV
ncbi:NTF2-related export protein 2 [Trichinella pseudospiralis]|uniref:NTF2-related export protein n=1 Tax=Trichinella pseudospiralis TaxID=6337 RepID=A0A0V1G4R5_TRIPS|nr:NTF2-related export protein 2 [Trichinella pseudospiralis]KRY93302.1 NTF2-related export protein 2 [Trichinella pseudospiralis]